MSDTPRTSSQAPAPEPKNEKDSSGHSSSMDKKPLKEGEGGAEKGVGNESRESGDTPDAIRQENRSKIRLLLKVPMFITKLGYVATETFVIEAVRWSVRGIVSLAVNIVKHPFVFTAGVLASPYIPYVKDRLPSPMGVPSHTSPVSDQRSVSPSETTHGLPPPRKNDGADTVPAPSTIEIQQIESTVLITSPYPIDTYAVYDRTGARLDVLMKVIPSEGSEGFVYTIPNDAGEIGSIALESSGHPSVRLSLEK